ncbi:hypothetical protein HK405_006156 [Cladochytrium tenue]|nr:hypothetical protein HK405_006156 [Cladochytrium tenue]
MKVLVIGGGIAGTAAALGFKRAGHEVEIYDRVEPPSPASAPGSAWVPADIGGAIFTNENVLRVYKHLGVLDEITAAGTKVSCLRMAKFDGRPFAEFPTFDGPEFKAVGVLRSAITRAINKALNSSGIFMKAGKKLVAIDQKTDGGPGVIAHFEDGTSAAGDILVGADGINSAVRQLLFPDIRPKRTKYSGYFAVSPLDDGQESPVFNILMDAQSGNQTFIMPAGKTMVHWGMFESRPDANDNDSWDLSGDLNIERSRMLDLVEKWGLPQYFRTHVERATRVIRVNFSSMPAMPQWHKHNCVLVGDAAHAVLPFSGQGAGMALETALVLPVFVDRFPNNPSAAFQLLHEFRGPRVAKVAAMGESVAKNSNGTSAATAAIGNLVFKIYSHFARLLKINFYPEDIIRYDVYDAAVKFLDAKAGPAAIAPPPARS